MTFINTASVNNVSEFAYKSPFRVVLEVSEASRERFLASLDKASLKQSTSLLPVYLQKAGEHDITSYCTGFDWTAGDTENFLTLNVSLDNHAGQFNMVPHGAKIKIMVRTPFFDLQNIDTAKFYPYITAFVLNKDRSGSSSEKTKTLTCYDRLYWAATSDVVDFVYKTDKRKPGGWTAHEIVRDMAKKLKIPVGKIDASNVKITSFEAKGKFLDEVKRVLRLDKKKSRRKKNYVIHMRDGRLNVMYENVNPTSALLIEDDVLIESGNLSEEMDEKFATQLVVSGTIRGKVKTAGGSVVGKVSKKEVTINPKDPTYQRTFGIIRRTVKLKGTLSSADFNKRAQDEMEAALKPVRNFTVNLRGYPGIWAGDRAYCSSRYFGVIGLVKVTSVNCQVSGAEFTMALTLGTDSKTKLVTPVGQLPASLKLQSAEPDF